jgi:hypothetical protein
MVFPDPPLKAAMTIPGIPQISWCVETCFK